MSIKTVNKAYLSSPTVEEWQPYTIEKPDEGRVVVHFEQWVSTKCTKERAEALWAGVENADEVAFELTGTELIGSDWWRCIGRLGKKAKRLGKRFVAVGVDPVLRTTADAVAASPSLEFVDSLDKAWA